MGVMTVISIFASHHLVAYLDGGTGSMLVQAALAGILSVAFMVKTQWRRVRAVLARRGHDQNTPSG